MVEGNGGGGRRGRGGKTREKEDERDVRPDVRHTRDDSDTRGMYDNIHARDVRPFGAYFLYDGM